MRESRFRNLLLADLQKIGAIVGAIRTEDIGIDGDSDGIGKGVKNPFDRNVFDRRMKERPHEEAEYKSS